MKLDRVKVDRILLFSIIDISTIYIYNSKAKVVRITKNTR